MFMVYLVPCMPLYATGTRTTPFSSVHSSCATVQRTTTLLALITTTDSPLSKGLLIAPSCSALRLTTPHRSAGWTRTTRSARRACLASPSCSARSPRCDNLFLHVGGSTMHHAEHIGRNDSVNSPAPHPRLTQDMSEQTRATGQIHTAP